MYVVLGVAHRLAFYDSIEPKSKEVKQMVSAPPRPRPAVCKHTWVIIRDTTGLAKSRVCKVCGNQVKV